MMEVKNNQGVYLLRQGNLSDAIAAFSEAAGIARDMASGHPESHSIPQKCKAVEWSALLSILKAFANSFYGRLDGQDEPIAECLDLPDPAQALSALPADDLQLRSAIVIYNLGVSFHKMSISSPNPQSCQERASKLYRHAQRLLFGVVQHAGSPAAQALCDLLALSVCHNLSECSSTKVDGFDRLVCLMQWIKKERPYRRQPCPSAKAQECVDLMQGLEDSFLLSASVRRLYPKAGWTAGAA